jgi:hypothetical protein
VRIDNSAYLALQTDHQIADESRNPLFMKAGYKLEVFSKRG